PLLWDLQDHWATLRATVALTTQSRYCLHGRIVDSPLGGIGAGECGQSLSIIQLPFAAEIRKRDAPRASISRRRQRSAGGFQSRRSDQRWGTGQMAVHVAACSAFLLRQLSTRRAFAAANGFSG